MKSKTIEILAIFDTLKKCVFRCFYIFRWDFMKKLMLILSMSVFGAMVQASDDQMPKCLHSSSPHGGRVCLNESGQAVFAAGATFVPGLRFIKHTVDENGTNQKCQPNDCSSYMAAFTKRYYDAQELGKYGYLTKMLKAMNRPLLPAPLLPAMSRA
jgi:hypothetical protein